MSEDPVNNFGKTVFEITDETLAKAKEKYKSGDKTKAEIIKSLQNDRTSWDCDPESIAVNKLRLPPSGDVHDYYSQAPYWFADPESQDGLPYIRRDGEFNPESIDERADNKKLKRLVTNAFRLATVYWFTEEEKAAQKCSELLKHWFLKTETRMNPNLNFGQAIPGITEGRDAGIIETHTFIQIINAVKMISRSDSWSKSDTEDMKRWIKEYLAWLITSKIGKEEMAAPNNHGAWYVALALKIADWCGEAKAAESMAKYSQKRIEIQIMPDGSLPEELQRTNAWSYSMFALNALLSIVPLTKKYGVNILEYAPPTGGTLKKAIYFLYPYATGERKWQWQQIAGFKTQTARITMILASHYLDDTCIKSLVDNMETYDDFSADLFYR